MAKQLTLVDLGEDILHIVFSLVTAPSTTMILRQSAPNKLTFTSCTQTLIDIS